MRYREVEVFGEEYADDARGWAAQHMVNRLPTPAERSGTRTKWIARQAPGLKPLVHIYRNLGETIEESGPVRGGREVEGKLLVVAGNTLWQISNDYVAIPLGTIPGVGRVSMTHNQRGLANEVLILTGSAGYIYNTGTMTLTRITDDAFPGGAVGFFIEGFFGVVESQGRYWASSERGDGLSWTSLSRYEAPGQPDRIVTATESFREAIIFGTRSTEFYVNRTTDDGNAPFDRASNTSMAVGCAAKFSVASLDNSVLWLDEKRIVRRKDGYTPVRISTQPIEQALAECTAEQIAAAFAFVWEDKGHKVYYLTVPGRFTFGYDVLSGRWHRRLTKGMERWRLNDLWFWNGKWVGGDYQSGRLYELDWDYAFDGQDSDGNPLELVRRTASGYLTNNQNRLRVHAVQFICRVGGPETIPVDFPVQPVGPTISGTPTAGQKCEDYSFTFTATGDGPLRFTLRSGTLPSGMRLTPTGELTATRITSSGEYTITVRVTDRHGLYADLTVTLGVAAVSWDYVTWLGPHAQVFTTPGPPAVLEPDTIIVPVPDFSGVGGRYRSTDGVTFTNLGAGWYQAAAVNPETGRLVFARTPAVMEWSDDAGTTVTTASGDAVSVERLVFQKDGFYAVGGGRYAFGGAEGETWVNGPADPDASVFFAWSELLEKWVRLSAGPPSLVQTSDDLLNGPWTSVATIPTSGLNQLGGFNIVRDVFYASTQGGQIWRSTDAVNWTLVHTLTGTIKGDISLLPDVGPTGSLVSYGGGAAKISVSQDNGLTWTDYNAPFSGGYGVYVEGTHTYVNVRHMATSVADIIDSCEVEP